MDTRDVGSWNGTFTITNNSTTPVMNVLAAHCASGCTGSWSQWGNLAPAEQSSAVNWNSGQTPTDYWFISFQIGTTMYFAAFSQSVRGYDGGTIPISIDSGLTTVTLCGNSYALSTFA